MKLKWFGLLLLIASLFGCISTNANYNLQTIPTATIQAVDSYTVTIAVYYEVTPEEAMRRQAEYNNKKYYLGQFITKPISPERVQVVYIGAGTIVQDNYIVSVAHLFTHDANSYSTTIFVMNQNWDVARKADLIVKTDLNDVTWWDDYAVIKLQGDLVPGTKIAKSEMNKGEHVVIAGSVAGFAFFSRVVEVTTFNQYLDVDEQSNLRLTQLADFPMWCVFPGGNGDSGGGIYNRNGELQTIMYCGITVYEECYIFANPLANLWGFLKAHNLEHIG